MAGVLQSAARAGDRHAHLGRLDRDVELGQQPRQQRVGVAVMNDKTRINGQRGKAALRRAAVCAQLVRVRVAPQPALGLEQHDIVGTRQDISGSQPGNATADDGDAAPGHAPSSIEPWFYPWLS
jgi:hypothetical protein